MNPLVYVFITVFSTMSGQLLIKSGVVALSVTKGSLSSVQFAFRALLNPSIVLGLGLAFVGAMSWIVAVRTLPLNYAYPFTALGIIMVVIASHFIFKEEISLIHWVSLALIVSGLVLLSFQKT